MLNGEFLIELIIYQSLLDFIYFLACPNNNSHPLSQDKVTKFKGDHLKTIKEF